ncbi:MAG: winged helix-turn-helix domain-containing protein [Clostridiales bacterium]|nr:winged helix-turn-helix domain-containing protein [Clostridiales bacterium]
MGKFGEKFGERFGEKFGENQTQEKIMGIMRRNPRMSARAISEEIGLTARSVEKVIRTLKYTGLIERVGAAKGGYWVVK